MSDNTIFDDVFRTMMEKMTFLVVPLINDVFHTSYPADVEIVQLRNEYQRVDGEIITDTRWQQYAGFSGRGRCFSGGRMSFVQSAHD